MTTRDWAPQAKTLFERFAARHALTYKINTDEPFDMLWTFPEQHKLSMPLVLGLGNGDELSLGVSDFWSYFFPFEETADEFESILDAWVTGEARVVISGPRSRLLQVRERANWRTVYRANPRLLPFKWKHHRSVMNLPITPSKAAS
jgi:hypothetical protein